MAPRRSPLHRVDDVVVPALRRRLRAAGAPFRALVRWETDATRPAAVRAVAQRPSAVAALAAVVVFAASAVHLDRATDAGAPPTPATTQGVDPAAATPPSEVGPLVGADIESYRSGRHALLGTLELDGPGRAVVSFTDYVDADDLPDLDGARLEALILRIPAEELRPRTVPLDGRDVVEAVDEAEDEERRLLDEEIADLEEMLEEDLGDPAFAADFEVRLDELRAARNLLAARAPIVFAAVVVGEVETLRALVDRDGVRVVDVGGTVDNTADSRFHGILPDDRERTTVGRAL